MTVYNNRVYRIDDISFEKSPYDKFICNKHSKYKEMTFASYVKENYKYDVYTKEQPMICHHDRKSGDNIFLIPEFCVFTGITEHQRRVNFKHIHHEVYSNAKTKALQAEEFFRKIKQGSYSEIWEKWNIEICETPLKVKAHEWDSATIWFLEDEKFEVADIENSFFKNVNGPYDSRIINNWVIIYGKSSWELYNQFVINLSNITGKYFKYECSAPIFRCIENEYSINEWIQWINSLLHGPKIDFIILITPVGDGISSIYESLKLFLQTEIHIPSQIVTEKSIKRNYTNLRTTVKNIMIQISAKIGDTPWALENISLMENPTMIIGVNACYKVGEKKRSVLSFVASLNQHLGKYYNSFKSKGERQEINFSFDQLIEEALIYFKDENKVMPQQIVIYRGALSDGEWERILNQELPAINNALQSLIDEKIFSEIPKILFIIANKNIEQRFCSKQNSEFKNPKKGLVIDEDITNP